jgi:hypothetical protein
LLNRKINIKFLLASLKTLNNSKDCSESRFKFLFQLFISLIGQFSLVCIHGRLAEKFSGSQADFETTFRITGGYQKAGTNFLMRVTGMVFTIGK